MAEPTDPITALAATVAEHHELYRAYVNAGFTEAQALDLLKTVITAGLGAAG